MTDRRLVYLFGIAGHPELSPALRAVEAAGWEVVVPTLPGFDGEAGFAPPDDYLDWITVALDALDATGALPCPLVGASVGGLLAAEVAALRPEAVTALALLAPFGICDAEHPGFDVFGTPAPERMAHLFAKGVPPAFADRFAERGPTEAAVARYLCDMAAANLLWPFGERGVAKRLHRIRVPRLTLWGELDELLPVTTAPRWGAVHTLAGAGHLLEWDAPEEVASALGAFLDPVG